MHIEIFLFTKQLKNICNISQKYLQDIITGKICLRKDRFKDIRKNKVNLKSFCFHKTCILKSFFFFHIL